MCKRVLTLSALLLLPMIGTAAADPPPEYRNKRTQKVLDTLKMFGISDPQVRSLVEQASTKVDKDGYYYIADHKMDNGRLSLRLEMQGVPQIRQLQIAYVPKDSHYSMTANTRGVMLNYHYEFK